MESCEKFDDSTVTCYDVTLSPITITLSPINLQFDGQFLRRHR
jgi:hypothetical protein